MPCIVLLLLLMGPRLVLFFLFLFTKYLNGVFETNLWPFLGFFFMPYSVLTYAIAMKSLGGVQGGVGLVVFIIGVLLDLGVIGGGASRRRGPPSTPSGGAGRVDENGLKRLN